VNEIPQLKLFTGIIRDITRHKELEREVVEVASLEQHRIGQDLHDSVGQELTALDMLAEDLADTLRTDPAHGARLVNRIAEGLRRSKAKLRTVMRGLLPVAVDSLGLVAALADLAERTQQDGNAKCIFACSQPVSMADNFTATHLYLIAQEAVYNAVKHAHAQNIRISMSLEPNNQLTLQVQDDGKGIPEANRGAEVTGGLGLRIMRNRAAIIGAQLNIEQAKPHGTLVACRLAWRNHGPKKGGRTRPGSDRR
jgi:signal transduction histidine kinase